MTILLSDFQVTLKNTHFLGVQFTCQGIYNSFGGFMQPPRKWYIPWQLDFGTQENLGRPSISIFLVVCQGGAPLVP
jgi:hypothetical protein